MNYKHNKFLSFLLALSIVLGIILTAYAEETTTYSGGTGTKDDPYKISKIEDWKTLAEAVNNGETYEGKYFLQTVDLDMKDVKDLEPVGTLENFFAGNYDGGGYTISNAAVNGKSGEIEGDKYVVAGLFGALSGKGSISNLIVTNVTITANPQNTDWAVVAGGLAAFAEDCTITDCSISDSRVTATATDFSFAGAVVGSTQAAENENTVFSNCASENNTVKATGYAGVFAGSIYSEGNGTLTFTACYSANNKVAGALAGAFLGVSHSGDISIDKCFVYDCSLDVTVFAGLFTAYSQFGKVNATNTYYYDKYNLPVNADSAISQDINQMKSLAGTLSDPFS